MSEADARHANTARLMETIAALKRIDIDGLPRLFPDDARERNVRTVAEAVVRRYTRFSRPIVNELSGDEVRDILDSAANDLETMKEWAALNPLTRLSAQGPRDAIAKQVEESWMIAFAELQGALTYANLDFLERKMAHLDRLHRDAVQVLGEARAAAAGDGVAIHAKSFLHQTKEDARNASRWLTAMIVLISLLLVSAILLFVFHESGLLRAETPLEAVQLGFAKLVYFSTLASFLYIAAGNYRALRHNAVVSKHRHNALRTYRVFAAGSADLPSRDIILAKAADTIFAPQPSGYGKDHAGESGPQSIVSLPLDVLREQASRQSNA